MVHIPYAGGNPAQLALLAGQVDLNFDNLAAASANIKAGKLQGAGGDDRAALERDARGADDRRERRASSVWRASTSTPGSASSRPAHLPAETTARLNKAFVDALASPELRARLASLLAEPMPMTPERFAPSSRRELAKYEPLVKASGARVE